MDSRTAFPVNFQQIATAAPTGVAMVPGRLGLGREKIRPVEIGQKSVLTRGNTVHHLANGPRYSDLIGLPGGGDFLGAIPYEETNQTSPSYSLTRALRFLLTDLRGGRNGTPGRKTGSGSIFSWDANQQSAPESQLPPRSIRYELNVGPFTQRQLR